MVDVMRELQQMKNTVEKAIEICAKGLGDGVLNGQKQQQLANLQKVSAIFTDATAKVTAASNPAAAKKAPVNQVG